MAEVKVYAKAIRGSEHVHSESKGAFVYFIPWVEINGHAVRTDTPEYKEWRERLPIEGVGPWAFEGDVGSISFDLGTGEGFAMLTIRHADDRSWEFLKNLDPDEWEYESTREEFNVFVTKFAFEVLEPKPKPALRYYRSSGV